MAVCSLLIGFCLVVSTQSVLSPTDRKNPLSTNNTNSLNTQTSSTLGTDYSQKTSQTFSPTSVQNSAKNSDFSSLFPSTQTITITSSLPSTQTATQNPPSPSTQYSSTSALSSSSQTPTPRSSSTPIFTILEPTPVSSRHSIEKTYFYTVLPTSVSSETSYGPTSTTTTTRPQPSLTIPMTTTNILGDTQVVRSRFEVINKFVQDVGNGLYPFFERRGN